MNKDLRRALPVIFLGILWVPTLHAAGTLAGTNISNTATATFTDPGGASQTVPSNTSILQVDEILDVTVAKNDATNVGVTTPDTEAVLSFTVTNIGNGDETFALTFNNALAGDQFNPTNTRIYLDANSNGSFEIGTDTLYVAGVNDPVLAPDGTRVVFVVSDIPAGLANADVGLVALLAEAMTARATPGADAPGTTFAGAGTGGSDAVVGSTQADGADQNGYVVAQVAVSFTKGHVVTDAFGGNNAVPGATITYTLTFAATGAGNLTGAAITDPIPAGTTYVTGSLTLNAAALTDAADADAGTFTGSGIAVALGTVIAPDTKTVTFKVTINN